MNYSILGQTEAERKLISVIRLAKENSERRNLNAVEALSRAFGGASPSRLREIAAEAQRRTEPAQIISTFTNAVREGQRLASSVFPNNRQWQDACERIEREEMEKENRRSESLVARITKAFTEATAKA